MLRRLVLALLLLTLPTHADAAIKFLEAGTSATQGVEFYSSITGSCASDATVVKTAPRSLKCTSGGAGAQAIATIAGPLADAGRRISFYWEQDLPTASLNILNVTPSGSGTVVIGLKLSTGGALAICGGGGTPPCTADSATTISALSPNRLALAYVITSSTNWTAKLFLNGSLIVTASNADFSLTTTGSGDVRIGWMTASTGNSKNFYVSDLYVDDGTGLDDPGDLRVTAKEPASNNTGNFTDSFGVAAPANRYTNVDDRPLDTTTGWINTNTTANAENYTLESASAGDVNLGSGTVAGYTHWTWAKRQGTGANSAGERWNATTGQCSKGQTGTDTTITCTGMTLWTGQLVYCALMTNNAAMSSVAVSDTLSNTWTPLNATSAGSGLLMFPFFASVGTGTKGGAASTVTFTYTSSASRKAVGCIAFDGVETSSPQDANPANTTDSTSTYNTNATGTLAQANEIVIAPFVLAHNAETITCASPTGTDTGVAAVTSAGSATTNVDFRFCYTLVAATTTLTPAATSGTNRTGLQGVATFKIRGNATPGAGTPKLTNNGTDTAQTLTTTPALYTVITTSGSYPSNAAGIGMVASGATAATVFYEGGALVAYTPAAPAPSPCGSFLLVGVGC